MRALGVALALFFAGCITTACPGFERSSVGTGCRDTRTGKFVSLTHCEEC